MGALVFPSLRRYDRRWLTGDLVAGLTVWAVLQEDGQGSQSRWRYSACAQVM
jgi:hypothetical protein